jgi:hypothetical protein
MTQQYVIDTLAKNGFTSEHYDQGMEMGSEEWMDIVETITGKNPYDDSVLTEDDNKMIWEFQVVMGELGIECW